MPSYAKLTLKLRVEVKKKMVFEEDEEWEEGEDEEWEEEEW
jgi:hypothetical protein